MLKERELLAVYFCKWVLCLTLQINLYSNRGIITGSVYNFLSY